MNRYEVLKTVGEGTYGVVLQCVERSRHRLVAVKRFKHFNSNAYVRRTMARELRAQQLLRGEPYVVQLLEAFKESGTLHLVMDYIEHNLLDMLDRHPDGLSQDSVRRLLFTLLLGVRSCHRAGIVHRDIKPENILVREDEGTATLCDFGFSRPKLNFHPHPSHSTSVRNHGAATRSSSLLSLENESLENEKGIMTDYVATRWYRSPEMLLGFSHYSFPVDLWAVGAIMAEACDGQPLLPGKTEVEQMQLIRSRIGPLPLSYESALKVRVGSKQAGLVRGGVSGEDIPEDEIDGMDLDNEPINPHFLEDRFEPLIGEEGVHLLRRLLVIDGRERITVEDALQHPFFSGLMDVYDPLAALMESSVQEVYSHLAKQEQLDDTMPTAWQAEMEEEVLVAHGASFPSDDTVTPTGTTTFTSQNAPHLPLPFAIPEVALPPPLPAASSLVPAPALVPPPGAPLSSLSTTITTQHYSESRPGDVDVRRRTGGTHEHSPPALARSPPAPAIGRRAEEILELSLSASFGGVGAEEEEKTEVDHHHHHRPMRQPPISLAVLPMTNARQPQQPPPPQPQTQPSVRARPQSPPQRRPPPLKKEPGETNAYRVISVDSLESALDSSSCGTPRSALRTSASHVAPVYSATSTHKEATSSGHHAVKSGRRHHHKHIHHHSSGGSMAAEGLMMSGRSKDAGKREKRSGSSSIGGGVPTLLFRTRRSMSPMTLSYVENEWMMNGGGGDSSKPPSMDGRGGGGTPATAAGNRPTPTLRRPTPQQPQGKISTCSSLSVGSFSFTTSPQTACGHAGGSSSSITTSAQPQPHPPAPAPHLPPPPRQHPDSNATSMESSHGEFVLPLGGAGGSGSGSGSGGPAPRVYSSSSGGGGGGGGGVPLASTTMPQKRLSTFKGGASPSSDNGLSVVSGVGGCVGGAGRLSTTNTDTAAFLPSALYSPNSVQKNSSKSYHRSTGMGLGLLPQKTSSVSHAASGAPSTGIGAFLPARRNSASLVDSGRQPLEERMQSISSAGGQHHHGHPNAPPPTVTTTSTSTTTKASISATTLSPTQTTIQANYLHLTHNTNFPSKTVIGSATAEAGAQWFTASPYPMQNSQSQVMNGTSKKKSRLVLRE